MLSENQLLEIKNRVNQITDGPWVVVVGQSEGEYLLLNADNYPIASSTPEPEMAAHSPEELLNFIAQARHDIPALLETIEQLKKGIQP